MLKQAAENGGLKHLAKPLRDGADAFLPLLRSIAADPAEDEVRRAAALGALSELYGALAEEDGAESEKRAEKLWVEIAALARPWLAEEASATLRAAAADVLQHDFDLDSEVLRAARLAGVKEGKFVGHRLEAIRAVGVEKDADGLAALLVALDDPDRRISSAAAEQLAEYGAKAAAAVPRLLELARDPKGPARNRYIAALGGVGARPELSMPFLKMLLSHDDPSSARVAAAEAMALVVAKNDLDPAPLLSQVDRLIGPEGGADFRNEAARALGCLGARGAPAVPQLVKFMGDSDRYGKIAAADALGGIGPAAKEGVSALVEGARSWEEADGVWALRALRKIKAGAPELAKAAPQLLQNAALRAETLETLAAFGPEAKEAVPAMLTLLDSSNFGDRTWTLTALEAMGTASKQAVPRLKKAAAEDPEESNRNHARRMLQSLAPTDPEVMEPALLGAAAVEPWRRDSAAKELAKSPELVFAGMRSEKPSVRRAAALFLALVVPPEQALPHYEKAYADPDAQVRAAAALRLVQAGRSPPGALELLVDQLDDQEVCHTLSRAGRAAALAAQIVLDPTKTDAQRRGAVDLLGRLGPTEREKMRWFGAALKSKDPSQRFWAADALGKDVAAARHDLLPVILENLRSSDAGRRTTAAGLAAWWVRTWVQAEGAAAPPELEAALWEVFLGEDEGASAQASYALSVTPFSPAVWAGLEKAAADPNRRRRAAELFSRGLGDDRADPKWTALLAAGLREAPPQEAFLFAPALAKMREAGRSALLDVFLDPAMPPERRETAAVVLCRTALLLDPPPLGEAAKAASLLKDAKFAPLAAAVLARWNYDWRPLAAPLLTLLAEEDSERADQADGAFALRWAEAKALTPELLKIAADPQSEGRLRVVRILSGENSDDATMVKLLEILADDPDGGARRSFAQAMSDQDAPQRPLKAFAAAIAKADGVRRLRLVETLQELWLQEKPRLDPPAELVGALAPLVQNEDAELGLAAAAALARLQAADADAVEVLVASLRKERPQAYGGESFQTELDALREAGVQAKGAVPRLVELLDDPHAGDDALRTLARIGPTAATAAAVPKLAARLTDPKKADLAYFALRNIGPAAAEAAPQLAAAMESELHLRVAAETLAAIRPEAAVAAMKKALEDPARRRTALEAIGDWGAAAKPMVPDLIEAIQGDDPDDALAALDAVARLEGEGAAAVPAVAGRVGSADPEMALAALRALVAVRSRPEAALPALLKALDRPEYAVKTTAAKALGALRKEGAPATATFAKWLADPKLCRAAAEALGGIGPAAVEAVPALMKVAAEGTPGRPKDDLRSYDFARAETFYALAEIGPAAKDAVPLLVKLAASKDVDLRRAAGGALWSIDPAAAQAAGAPQPPPRSRNSGGSCLP